MTMLHRRRFAAAAAAALGAPFVRAQEDDAALQAAIAAPHRSAANRARDAARHPYETLRFFGLHARQRVVELSPGGGWYTEILAPYLRAQGRLVLAAEAVDDPDEARQRGRRALDDKLARDPQLYDRVVVGVMPRTPRLVGLGAPGQADLVLTFRNVHNWLEAGHLDATLQAVQVLLRPGGVLGVVEHRAPADAAPAWTTRNGYVREDLFIARAAAAGLVLEARSEVNANPRDTKDHPHGVWSLPPTLRGGDVERARYLAVGESDRYTHRYVKR